MNTIDLLTGRITPASFAPTPPPPEQIEAALAAAVAAPDHGRMRPWRFITIEGEARMAFGEVLVEALRQRKPEATAGELDRERAKPLRSPLLVVAIAKTMPRPGIPEIEQVMAVAAAVENLSIALHAQGLASAWKTGEPAYDSYVKQALGLQEVDQIVGFLYVGTPASEQPTPRPRPLAAEFVSQWHRRQG